MEILDDLKKLHHIYYLDIDKDDIENVKNKLLKKCLDKGFKVYADYAWTREPGIQYINILALASCPNNSVVVIDEIGLYFSNPHMVKKLDKWLDIIQYSDTTVYMFTRNEKIAQQMRTHSKRVGLSKYYRFG